MNGFLSHANTLLQRIMPVLAPCSVVAGLIIGAPLAQYSGGVFWVFALMTFTAGLSLEPEMLVRVLRRPVALLVMLGLLHGAVPLVAWLGGNLFFSDPDIRLGLLLISLTPVGSTSLIWVSLYRGNVSLALSVIVLDTLLVPFILPFALHLLAGTSVELDSVGMWRSLCGMLLVPTALAVLANRLTGGRARTKGGPVLSLASKLGIVFLLSVNGGIAAPYFASPSWLMVWVLCSVFLLCCSGYLLSFWVGKRLFPHSDDDIVAFTICGGLRNIAAGAAIAMMYFSSVTCFTVVLGMMLQQLLGCNAGMLARRRLNAQESL